MCVSLYIILFIFDLHQKLGIVIDRVAWKSTCLCFFLCVRISHSWSSIASWQPPWLWLCSPLIPSPLTFAWGPPPLSFYPILENPSCHLILFLSSSSQWSCSFVVLQFFFFSSWLISLSTFLSLFSWWVFHLFPLLSSSI